MVETSINTLKIKGFASGINNFTCLREKSLAKLLVEACDMIEQLQAENDKKTEALESIDRWAKAYPLDIFQKPDLKKAADVLKAAGMTLDAITGDAMRHVLDGIKDIVKQALEESDEGVLKWQMAKK